VQIADLLASSLREDFDGAVGVVAHPASNSEDMRLSLDEPAEADTLDAATYQEAAGLKAFS
jgi:hypothetical protein